MTKLTRKRLILIVASCLLLIIVATLLITKNSNSDIQASLACRDNNNELIKQAVESIQGNDIESLGSEVATIEELDGYGEDPSCLYVSTIYYILLSDGTQARESLEKLKSKTNEHEIDPAIYPVEGYAIEQMEDSVVFLESINDSDQPNYIIIDAGGSGE